MKAKRRIFTLFALVAIIATATFSLVGCSGTLSVNPVNNSEFIKEIGTVVWDEGATRYDNSSRNNPGISVAELTSGTQSARYYEVRLEVASNKFDGYEVFQVEFDIVADRDIEVPFGLYYGGGLEANLRHRETLNLKANETVHQEWNLDKNFILANGDKSPVVTIRFDGRPMSGSSEFTAWSQTKYRFSNFKFYAVAPSK